MSLRGEDALIAAMDYTKQSLAGAGALKGEKGDKGEDGISPIATVSKTDNVTTVSISDKFGTTEAEILDGKDGVSPTVVIGGNGNWFINGEDTGVSAKGLQGETGKGFQITKQYSNIDEMVSDTEPANDSEVVVVIDGEVGNFYLRLTGYIDPEGITDNYLPIGSATEISSIKGEKGDDGITPRIDPITKRWFIGEVDTGVFAEGKDGDSPTIGENGNWFIGGIDTGIVAKGKDGRSILSITKDNNENIIVTYSDGTTENIGKLEVDVQADFLTSSGFGNLRFTDNKFQYYDKNSSDWVDTQVTPDNVYITNVSPQPMKNFFAECVPDTLNVNLYIEEPNDTVIDKQVFCIVEKVIIRRKKDSVPTDENDGDFVLEIHRKDFGSYKKIPYTDIVENPLVGDKYYYKAFPISNTGFVANITDNETMCIIKDYYLYGFKLDQNESDPASMISYIADNSSYRSAYMDYDTDTFNYGSWENAWFIRDLKPCMLNYDGTVAYELSKSNYSLKADGTASDIADDTFTGNAMIGFPKVYWKIVDNGDNTANIYFSNKKVDDDFVCWSHIDNNGNEIDYCYMPIYNGYSDGTRLRSLSGKIPIYSQTPTVEFSAAKANNLTSDTIWNIGLFSDRQLINLLLILIGKSTDTQTIFGNGYVTKDATETNKPRINTGTMDSQGLFWGSNTMTSGVKVFGMENYWGNQWQRIAGYVNAKGVQKIKLTYGQSDGSSVNGYNMDGSGYIEFSEYDTSNIQTAQYISEMYPFSFGLLPKLTNGSSTTYFTDNAYIDRNYNCVLIVGGRAGYAYSCGALCTNASVINTMGTWSLGASVSCKPLATT